MFFKLSVLQNFAVFTGNDLCRSLFFIKLKKETHTLVLSCEYCKILKNSFFYRTPQVAAFQKCSFISSFGISKNSFPVVHEKKITIPLFKEENVFNKRKFWTDMKYNLTGHISTPVILLSVSSYTQLLFGNRKRRETCSMLTKKPPERRHWRRSVAFIVNFKDISQFFFSVFVVAFEQANVCWVEIERGHSWAFPFFFVKFL